VGQHETVRILITGSRSWDDRATLWAALDEVALEHRVVVVRNGEMVAAGADLCLTFIQECPCPRRAKPHGTHGSVDCATKAARAGIPVRHVRPAMEAAR
jgi:hypothetical protein